VNQLTNRFYKLKLWTDCRGQDMLEYALAAGMVAMASVAAMPVLSAAVNNVFSQVGSAIIANIH
jgi:pilus assembly protein Flp/PilA